MHIQTYRAKSLQQALRMVQAELGPDAQVLQTREVETGLWERLAWGRRYEIRTRVPTVGTPLPLRRHGASGASASRATMPSSSEGVARGPTESDVLGRQQASGLVKAPGKDGAVDRIAAPSGGPPLPDLKTTLGAASAGPTPGLAWEASSGPSSERRQFAKLSELESSPPVRDPVVAPSSDLDALASPRADGFDYRDQLRKRLQESSAGPPLEELGEDRWHADSPPTTGTTGSPSLSQDGPDPAAGSGSNQRSVSTQEKFTLMARLLDQEIGESVAEELVRLAADKWIANGGVRESLHDRLVRILESELRVSAPLDVVTADCRRVALVGPTGVGKTTTIAKLAATLRLCHKRGVGLITVDTYRVAAVEQLRTYADIIDLPLEVVATPREMREAVVRMADQEIVLIDTAGRSPQDEVQLQELRAVLQEARADEVHLVLSAVGSASHLVRLLHRFRPVGLTSLLITKIDEAASLGSLLAPLRDSRLPISYLTCGQSVPEDIVTADVRSLARVLLGEAKIESLHQVERRPQTNV